VPRIEITAVYVSRLVAEHDSRLFRPSSLIAGLCRSLPTNAAKVFVCSVYRVAQKKLATIKCHH